MKKTFKIITFLLAFAMSFSLVGQDTFAASETNVQKYNSMLALGSSISRGCGLGDAYEDYDNPAYLHGLEGSFPSIVANDCEVPADNRYFCTFQGETLSSILSVLGLDKDSSDILLTDSWFADHYYQSIKKYFGDGGVYQLSGTNGTIANSDLIVIELGMSDIYYRAKEISNFEEAFTGEEGYDLTTCVTEMVKEMNVGYKYVRKNYSKLLDYIKKYNPDAQVVIVGMYNMFNDVTLSEDSVVPVGTAFSTISASLNQYLKALAKKYGYAFADVSNVGTPASEQGMAATSEVFLADMNHNIHPSTDNGLPYIARQIISVLPEETAVVKNPYDITIDLGYIKKVDYVLVNNRRVTNFTLDGSILTIPYTSSWARSVNIAAKQDDGDYMIQSYQLAYHDGYTAYRIYGTTNAVAKLKKIFNKLYSTVNK